MANLTFANSTLASPRATQTPNQKSTEDHEENPFYVPTLKAAENGQSRPVKKRRTNGLLNVIFAPSPPSPPRRIRFAEVTRVKRDTTDLRSRLTNYTCTPADHELYEYAQKPPSVQELMSTTNGHGIPDKVYQEVYYSKETDASDHTKEYAGILFRVRGGIGLSVLDEWEGEDETSMSGLLKRKKGQFQLPRIVGIDGWEYNQYPPSHREVRGWFLEDSIRRKRGERNCAWASQVILDLSWWLRC